MSTRLGDLNDKTTSLMLGIQTCSTTEFNAAAGLFITRFIMHTVRLV